MRNVRLEVIRARMERGKKYKAKIKYLDTDRYFTVTSVVYDGRESSVYSYSVRFQGVYKFPLSHLSVYDWREIE